MALLKHVVGVLNRCCNRCTFAKLLWFTMTTATGRLVFSKKVKIVSIISTPVAGGTPEHTLVPNIAATDFTFTWTASLSGTAYNVTVTWSAPNGGCQDSSTSRFTTPAS